MSTGAPACVGIDGGGTTTRVLVTDRRGRELVRVDGPASLIDAGRPLEAATVVSSVVRDALGRVGETSPVIALHAALAGAGREDARAAVEEALREEGLARSVRVGTDAEAAFHDVFGSGPGILVLAGTGSVGWGRSESGREARVGGWGRLVGDEGSGWSIGLAGLRAVARAVDGRGPSTALTEEVVEHLGLEAPDELLPWVERAAKAEVADLVDVVRSAARGGDRVATEILRGAVRTLEAHVTALAGRLGPWTGRPTVALGGGLLGPGGALREDVCAALRRRGMPVERRTPDPARGAAELARLELARGSTGPGP